MSAQLGAVQNVRALKQDMTCAYSYAHALGSNDALDAFVKVAMFKAPSSCGTSATLAAGTYDMTIACYCARNFDCYLTPYTIAAASFLKAFIEADTCDLFRVGSPVLGLTDNVEALSLNVTGYGGASITGFSGKLTLNAQNLWNVIIGPSKGMSLFVSESYIYI